MNPPNLKTHAREIFAHLQDEFPALSVCEIGGRLRGNSPFRSDSDSMGFVVFPPDYGFKDFAGNESGDIIELARMLLGTGYKETFQWIDQKLGLKRQPAPVLKPASAFTWPANGTSAIDYSPDGPEPTPDELAASYGLEWADFTAAGFAVGSWPANDEFQAVCYRVHHGAVKYKTLGRNSKNKRAQTSRPSNRGQGVIGPLTTVKPGGVLVLAGGEEKMLAATRAGFHAVCLSNGEQCPTPTSLEAILAVDPGRVIVCYDADQHGRNAAQDAAQKFNQAGVNTSWVNWPPDTPDKWDLNDVLLADGADGIMAIINSAEEVAPDMAEETPTSAGQVATCVDGLRIIDVPNSANSQIDKTELGPGNLARPIIEISTLEIRVNDQALEALSDNPDIYQRAGELVEVLPATAKKPAHVAPVETARLRELLSASCQFKKFHATRSRWEDSSPPDWCVKAVEARKHRPRIRELEGVIQTPVILPDGSVLQKPGYDEKTGLFYAPSQEYSICLDEPTQEQCQLAAEYLLDLVADFPFKDQAHRAGWLASALTPFARYAYRGPAPMFLADGNVRGAGKSLLFKLVGRLFNGTEPAMMANTPGDSETEKRITAIYRDGTPLVMMDNASGKIGCPSLDSAITAEQWTGRVLGSSDMWTGPAFTTWYGTGNNLTLAGDLDRRVLRMRLESQEESPEERGGFKYPDVLAHVSKNRHKYIKAALTILRGYFVAGKPDYNLTPWGSFEAFTSVVRNAVVHAGQPDPGGHQN